MLNTEQSDVMASTLGSSSDFPFHIFNGPLGISHLFGSHTSASGAVSQAEEAELKAVVQGTKDVRVPPGNITS